MGTRWLFKGLEGKRTEISCIQKAKSTIHTMIFLKEQQLWKVCFETGHFPKHNPLHKLATSMVVAFKHHIRNSGLFSTPSVGGLNSRDTNLSRLWMKRSTLPSIEVHRHMGELVIATSTINLVVKKGYDYTWHRLHPWVLMTSKCGAKRIPNQGWCFKGAGGIVGLDPLTQAEAGGKGEGWNGRWNTNLVSKVEIPSTCLLKII